MTNRNKVNYFSKREYSYLLLGRVIVRTVLAHKFTDEFINQARDVEDYQVYTDPGRVRWKITEYVTEMIALDYKVTNYYLPPSFVGQYYHAQVQFESEEIVEDICSYTPFSPLEQKFSQLCTSDSANQLLEIFTGGKLIIDHSFRDTPYIVLAMYIKVCEILFAPLD